MTTARARHKIKAWIRHQEDEEAQELGRELLVRESKRRRLAVPETDAAASPPPMPWAWPTAGWWRSRSAAATSPSPGHRAIYPEVSADDLQEPRPSVIGRVIDRIRLGSGIRIQGLSGLMVRYAQCCQPVPGDGVVGYVTQGRGISIHRADCPNLLTLSGEGRRVEIDWQEVEG